MQNQNINLNHTTLINSLFIAFIALGRFNDTEAIPKLLYKYSSNIKRLLLLI